MLIPVLILSIIAPNAKATPPGTPVYVRLTTAVGSYASKAGAPIQALVIAPATLADGTVLPPGTVITRRVKRAARVGLGIRHETASLDLEFSQVALPGGAPAPVQARLVEVDNARERVARDGRIHGVRATDSGSYRVSGYVRDLLFRCELHARLAELIVKAAVINLPEPEIYLPAGSELTLELTGVPALAASAAEPPATRLSSGERADLDRLAAILPSRT